MDRQSLKWLKGILSLAFRLLPTKRYKVEANTYLLQETIDLNVQNHSIKHHSSNMLNPPHWLMRQMKMSSGIRLLKQLILAETTINHPVEAEEETESLVLLLDKALDIELYIKFSYTLITIGL